MDGWKRIYGGKDGWLDGCESGWVYGRGWVDGRKGWVAGWKEGRKEGIDGMELMYLNVHIQPLIEPPVLHCMYCNSNKVIKHN